MEISVKYPDDMDSEIHRRVKRDWHLYPVKPVGFSPVGQSITGGLLGSQRHRLGFTTSPKQEA